MSIAPWWFFFFLIPQSECSFVKNTHSITDLKVIGTLTVNEGILNTLEPLQKTSSSFISTELRGITGIKVLKGTGWETIPISVVVSISIPVAVTVPVAATVPVAVHLDDLS